MVRDSNPKRPGEDGIWFRVRKNGSFIDVPPPIGLNADDPKLGWMPLDWLTSHQPTASDLVVLFDDSPGENYNLYLNKSSGSPSNSDDIVDVDKYGLKKNDAIIMEDKVTNNLPNTDDKNNDDKADNGKDGNDSDKDNEDGDNGDKDSNNGDKDSNDGDKNSNDGDKNSNDGDKNSNDGDKDNNGDENSNNGDENGDDSNKDSNDGGNDDDGKNNDNSTGREYPPRFPHTNGYWFVVKNRHGNNIDVSAGATAVNSDDSALGWNPIPKDSDLPTFFVASGRIRRKITQSLELNPQDYKLYGSQSDDDSNHYTDNYVIDFRSVGLRGNDPMMVKYNTSRDNDSDGGSQTGDDVNGGNDQDDNSNVNTDPYASFTRRLENITTGDWSIYPEAITGTYSGEILWTDGNPSYSFASAPNIQAYKVVRRNPSVYNGTVIQTGLASTSPYYFKLLD